MKNRTAFDRLYLGHLVIAVIAAAGGIVGILFSFGILTFDEAQGSGILIGMFGAVPFLIAAGTVVRYTVPAFELQLRGQLPDKRPLLLLVFPSLAILGMVLEPEGVHRTYETLTIDVPVGIYVLFVLWTCAFWFLRDRKRCSPPL